MADEIKRKRAREKDPAEKEKDLQVNQEEVENEQEKIEETTEEESGIQISEITWKPKTELGRKVLAGEITDIEDILNSQYKLLEQQIVDYLLPNLEVVLLNVGQAKGKFGGGKRNIWRQTQKKTKEGNTIKFATFAAVGNKEGYIGIGFSKAKETVPAREKAIRAAKLSLIKIPKGCGSWACVCGEGHSIPYKTEGKSGSVKIRLDPAPKGTGLLTEKEIKRMLHLVGIKDIYSKTFGQTKTKINLIKATFEALKNLSKFKLMKIK